MQVKVRSMAEANNEWQDADVVLSIADEDVTIPFQGSKDKHLVLRFLDTEHPDDHMWMQMNREVRTGLAWLAQKELTEESTVLIHCYAGISRSSAMAWLFLVQRGIDAKEAFQMLFKARPRIHPNTLVLSFGADFLKLPPEFMRLVKDVDAEIEENRRKLFGY